MKTKGFTQPAGLRLHQRGLRPAHRQRGGRAQLRGVHDLPAGSVPEVGRSDVGRKGGGTRPFSCAAHPRYARAFDPRPLHMNRRPFLALLASSAASLLLAGHTPYMQWKLYRQAHLLIFTTRDDAGSDELGERIAARLRETLPDSQAQVRARAERSPHRQPHHVRPGGRRGAVARQCGSAVCAPGALHRLSGDRLARSGGDASVPAGVPGGLQARPCLSGGRSAGGRSRRSRVDRCRPVRNRFRRMRERSRSCAESRWQNREDGRCASGSPPLVLSAAAVCCSLAWAHDLITAEAAERYLAQAAENRKIIRSKAPAAQRAQASYAQGAMLDEIRDLLNRDIASHGKVQGLPSEYLVAALAAGGTPLATTPGTVRFPANLDYYRESLRLAPDGSSAADAVAATAAGLLLRQLQRRPARSARAELGSAAGTNPRRRAVPAALSHASRTRGGRLHRRRALPAGGPLSARCARTSGLFATRASRALGVPAALSGQHAGGRGRSADGAGAVAAVPGAEC